MEGLQTGEKKQCPKCQKIKSINDFKDKKLTTGYGRHCADCKRGGGKHVFSPTHVIQGSTTSEVTCPKCGAPMFVRERKKDKNKFYGCSRFPRCYGTRGFST